eukprot:GHVL01038435.1.p1 GENE.GHVL01038435.1~~GHVL01038435.1.p1  ORF type:complete len:154 (-),score=20.63 GHVL01038435.1:681-1142(-)
MKVCFPPHSSDFYWNSGNLTLGDACKSYQNETSECMSAMLDNSDGCETVSKTSDDGDWLFFQNFASLPPDEPVFGEETPLFSVRCLSNRFQTVSVEIDLSHYLIQLSDSSEFELIFSLCKDITCREELEHPYQYSKDAELFFYKVSVPDSRIL